MQEAEKYALTSVEAERPTWAIIVVNHLDVEGGNVDYKIRMNFTTVPSTWDTLHKERKGLLTYYKHYFTSGFLSLQVGSLWSIRAPSTAVLVHGILFMAYLLPISCTKVTLLDEQDAINGYVLQLAPEQKQADFFTKKPMWGAPFPTPAYKRNKFYHSVCFHMIFLVSPVPWSSHSLKGSCELF